MPHIDYVQSVSLPKLLDVLTLSVSPVLSEVDRAKQMSFPDSDSVVLYFAKTIEDLRHKAQKVLNHPMLSRYELQKSWEFNVLDSLTALLEEVNDYYGDGSESLYEFLGIMHNRLRRAQAYISEFYGNIT